MNRALIFPALAAACIALAGCTDADYENAMSYLPLEQAPKTAQEVTHPDIPSPTAATAYPVPASPAMEAHMSQQNSAQPLPSSSPTVLASTPGAMSSQAINQHCRAVATQRASDGRYMGMDDDAQKKLYDRAYADCAAWDAAHGGG